MSASDTWTGDEFPHSTSTCLPGGWQPPGRAAPTPTITPTERKRRCTSMTVSRR
jgi:hypothetical protein